MQCIFGIHQTIHGALPSRTKNRTNIATKNKKKFKVLRSYRKYTTA